MALHLMREVENLKKLLLHLAAEVENNLRLAVRAVNDRDARLAEQVIETDLEIDRREVGVEEECLKILALYQPVAQDLRFIVAILKINHDLERVGDLAVNIAERALTITGHPPVGREFPLTRLVEKAQTAVSRSLDAFINQDLALAREIWLADDDADRFNRELLDAVEDQLRKHPEQLPSLMAIASISRTLERIADHATNISKDVIYMIEGEIVRHRSRQYRERLGKNGESRSAG